MCPIYKHLTGNAHVLHYSVNTDHENVLFHGSVHLFNLHPDEKASAIFGIAGEPFFDPFGFVRN